MPDTEQVTNTLVINGATLVNSKTPGTSKTLDEYARVFFLQNI